MLKEPSKITSKIIVFKKIWKSTLITKNNIEHLQNKRIRASGFCSVIGHTISSCTIKINIGKVVNGGILIEHLQNVHAFKVIDIEQSNNVFSDVIEGSRIQHIRYEQLLYSIILCSDNKSEEENINFKVKYYNKNGIAILGVINIMIEFKLIVSIIHRNKTCKYSTFVLTIKEECIVGSFFSYKRNKLVQKVNVAQIQHYLLQFISESIVEQFNESEGLCGYVGEKEAVRIW